MKVDALGRPVPERAVGGVREPLSRHAASRLLHSRTSGQPAKVL